MKSIQRLCVILCLLLVRSDAARAQWQSLYNPCPIYANTMLLLTDGTVMCQDANGTAWWRLTPDKSGNYVTGTWSHLASMANARLYFASALLADGRVVVAGGEYNGGDSEVELDAAEIYDPLANTWSTLPTPSGWSAIGDAPNCVLPNGHWLLGSIYDTRTAILNPVSLTWSVGGSKNDPSSEETWTLMPDGTVVDAECINHPLAEKYVPSSNSWVSAGTVPDDLVEAASIEIGPAILLPNGKLFATGATGRTALYTPNASKPSAPGAWKAGPSYPVDPIYGQLGAKDAPACLLPSGHVLTAVGPVDGVGDDYLSPTFFFEYDGTHLNQVATSGNSYYPPYAGVMLLLPTGQVLFSNQSHDIEVYTPEGTPQASWAPQITSAPVFIAHGPTYTIEGTQFNGLAQAVSYGDDSSEATNYPLVRLTFVNTNDVVYCRTFNHSTMAVATGTALVSTNFTVPNGVETGPADLSVVANGIASPSVAVTVGKLPTLVSVTLSPTTVVGSKTATGKIKLNAAAPPGGSVVTLTNTNSAATVPANVTVAYGETTATFTIQTAAVTTVQAGKVTASYNSVNKVSNLTVRPIGVLSFGLHSKSVKGGTSVTGTVALEEPAAPGKITVTFTSSDTSVVPTPAGITIPAGTQKGTITVQTKSVTASTTVTLSATANGITKSVKLTVTP